jgi:hypothetical protein
MDMISGIAQTSMEMASTKLNAEVQVAMLKKAMDVQQESLAGLLKSMGIGRQLDIRG